MNCSAYFTWENVNSIWRDSNWVVEKIWRIPYTCMFNKIPAISGCKLKKVVQCKQLGEAGSENQEEVFLIEIPAAAATRQSVNFSIPGKRFLELKFNLKFNLCQLVRFNHIQSFSFDRLFPRLVGDLFYALPAVIHTDIIFLAQGILNISSRLVRPYPVDVFPDHDKGVSGRRLTPQCITGSETKRRIRSKGWDGL